MTVQVSKTAAAINGVALDTPIFDPHAFRLDGEQAAIVAAARELGQSVFAARAAAYDRDAEFPTENYKDLHRAGLLGISIPKRHGGLGAGYQTYALAAAEIGRYCGATALTWNMHVCSTLWSGPLADDLDMDADMRAEHERRRAVQQLFDGVTDKSMRPDFVRMMQSPNGGAPPGGRPPPARMPQAGGPSP